MRKIMCCPASLLPKTLAPDVSYFTLYSPSERTGVGHVGIEMPISIRRFGLIPSVRAWDFATIAFCVDAADKAVLRSESADGWTRMIDLSICLNENALWENMRNDMENLLRFLTGDFWTLHFLKGGQKPPKAKTPKNHDADCICLLSGGVDSLVGAIDLTSEGKKPLFVSQIVRGDRDAQHHFVDVLSGNDRHCQWSFAVNHPGPSETSTRARSIVFFAFAALAASAFESSDERSVEIVVPENGFISLNVPLGYGRLGSLSTKTTHPIYTEGIQSIWNAVGIHAKLLLPYRYRTKGELVAECADQAMLLSLIADSTSCGKYQRKLQHCGQCIPCLVRRAAFLKAGLSDCTTRGYRVSQLSLSKSKDVTAAATAYLRYEDKGVRRFVGGALSFASSHERNQYEGIVSRGMDELGQLLRSHGVI